MENSKEEKLRSKIERKGRGSDMERGRGGEGRISREGRGGGRRRK